MSSAIAAITGAVRRMPTAATATLTARRGASGGSAGRSARGRASPRRAIRRIGAERMLVTSPHEVQTPCPERLRESDAQIKRLASRRRDLWQSGDTPLVSDLPQTQDRHSCGGVNNLRCSRCRSIRRYSVVRSTPARRAARELRQLVEFESATRRSRAA